MTEPTTLVRLTKTQYDSIATTAAMHAAPGTPLREMAHTVFAHPFTPAPPPRFDPVQVRFPDGSIRAIIPVDYEYDDIIGRGPNDYRRNGPRVTKPVFDVPGYVIYEVLDVTVQWVAVEGLID